MTDPVRLDPTRMRADGGLGWAVGRLPLPLGDDEWRPRRSRLVLTEDGKEMRPGHSLHNDIRRLGGGRYSHWGSTLFFSTSDGSDPRHNNRRYQVVWQDAPSPVLDDEGVALVQAIGAGDRVEGKTLARYLSKGRPESRAWAMVVLGDALMDQGRFPDGAQMLFRAWELGVRLAWMWRPILRWLTLGAQRDLAMGLFRAAAAAAEQAGDVDWMCDVLVQYETYVFAQYGETHRLPFQDDALVDPALRLFAPYRKPVSRLRSGPILRIGYLLCGEALGTYHHHTDLAIELACAHDRRLVEPVLLSLHDQQKVVADNPFFIPWQEKLTARNLSIRFLDRASAGETFDDVLALADTIRSLDLDALVFMNQSGLSFILAALRPARLMMGLGLGEPSLYTSRVLDVASHFALRPAMDSFCPAEIMPSFISADRLTTPSRVLDGPSLGAPAGSVVVVSVGRAMKFASALYWHVLAAALRHCPSAHAVLVGIEAEQVLSHARLHGVEAELAGRITALGWRNDVIDILSGCDIYLDTLPYGGGHTVFEALNQGLPVVMAEDDYWAAWDVRTWSPAAEPLPGDVGLPLDGDVLTARLVALIENAAERQEWRHTGPSMVQNLKSPKDCAAAVARIARRYLGDDA